MVQVYVAKPNPPLPPPLALLTTNTRYCSNKGVARLNATRYINYPEGHNNDQLLYSSGAFQKSETDERPQTTPRFLVVVGGPEKHSR